MEPANRIQFGYSNWACRRDYRSEACYFIDYGRQKKGKQQRVIKIEIKFFNRSI